ncbi:glycerophosphodiester phosphodiesterase [Parapedobacter sp. 10938]|uniref:glycerophosphodiester phosphodiesterase n=1 Tax=Parapedobacter flavus TaxID=3110225 RepID=UPI002DBF4626|nr:glycerophosphodiester phosphodiesterase family protein [Parapedobacter sp. 10938]MEC3878116.1 glycerophosphodiester phosphodiesterase family protein [Parapedobacter sp. 10938]
MENFVRRCFLLLLLVSCIEGAKSQSWNSIVWNKGTIDLKISDTQASGSEFNSGFLVFSQPAVIRNTISDELGLYLLEFDTSGNLIKHSQAWLRSDMVITDVKNRKFRLLAKGLTANAINSDRVSKHIMLSTGSEAQTLIKQKEDAHEKAASSVFATTNTYQNPLYMAHRGYSVDAPENSIPAFIHAGQKNAWAIETDLRFTKDSVVVCIHDATLDSRYNGTGKVSDYTYQELLEMKIAVGNNLNSYADDELRIPTLEEYLNICKAYGAIAFIELKEDASDEIVAAAKKLGMEGRYIVSSSKIEFLIHFRSLSNEVVHHINMKPTSSFLNALVLMGNASTGFNRYDPSGADKELIEKCHFLGLRVCFRGVDTAEYAKKCIDGGLDFLPSNTMPELK